LSDETQRVVFDRLCDVLRRTGRRDDLELALEAELSSDDLDLETRVRLGGELAALIGARVIRSALCSSLRPLIAERPDDQALLGDIVALARQAGDKDRQVEALGACRRDT